MATRERGGAIRGKKSRPGKHCVSNNTCSLLGLMASGPDPRLKDDLSLFGQFVGDWEIFDARYLQKDGTWIKMKGELHFGWILGGTAIQDVWIGHVDGSDELTLFGTTIRFYDPKIRAWRSTWLSPLKGLVKTFIARKVNDEIVLEGKTTEGHPEKWIFDRIKTNSFRWHSEETRDGGKTWTLTEEMHIRRARPSR